MTTATAPKVSKGYRPVGPAIYSNDVQAWLDTAYKTIVKVLRKQDTFHVNDFWSHKDTLPFPGSYFSDARVLSAVFRQAIREGLMRNDDPEYGRRVYTDGKPTSTYKPVYTSLIRK